MVPLVKHIYTMKNERLFSKRNMKETRYNFCRKQCQVHEASIFLNRNKETCMPLVFLSGFPLVGFYLIFFFISSKVEYHDRVEPPSKGDQPLYPL